MDEFVMTEKAVESSLQILYLVTSICLFAVWKPVALSPSAGARQAPLRQLKLKLWTVRFPLYCEAFFFNTSGFYSVEIELNPGDSIMPNPSNVGHLHTDYPMDTSTDRFKKNINKQVKDLKESTDRLVGAISRFEESREEADWWVARSVRMEV
jgi:hypothetical protein